MYRNSLTLLALLCFTGAAAITVGPAVTIQNLRLFYGSNEFYIKGMGYSPSPLAKVVENQNFGTGLCTPKRAYTPGSYNNIQLTSPCLMEDYFDGTVYPGGPSAGWWNGIWQRDLPVIKSLGVNTLRIYHVDPITSLEVSSNPNYADKTIIGANHIPFLDLAYSYGFKVVFPLFADESAIGTISQTFMMEYIENLIDEVGYHPAVLMYQFGNELQFLNNGQDYVNKINLYMAHARSYQLQRWSRALPVSTALIDYPPYYNTLVPALDMDIITTNAGYRGYNFQNLWSGGSSSFIGLQALSCMTGRPTLVGEMGVHVGQSSSVPFDMPTIFPSMMADIIAHKKSGAIGGFYFEWQEEHWKGVAYVGQDWTQAADVFMGAVTLSNGTGQFPIDPIHTKTGGAYDWNAALQTFALNVWAQDGPATLGQTTNNYCVGYATSITGSTPSTSGSVVVSPSPAPVAACQSMFSQLTCRTTSEDPSQLNTASVASARNWLCTTYPQFCTAINSGGTYSSCNSAEQLSYAMNLYYAQYGPGASACSFSGIGNVVSAPVTSSTSKVSTPATTSASTSSCQSMYAQLSCRTTSEDPAQLNPASVASARNWLCTTYPQFCTAINSGGTYSSCNSAEQLSYAMAQYYAQYGPTQGATACNFGGVGNVVSAVSSQASTPTATSASTSSCQSMFSQLKCRTASEDPTKVDAGAVSSTRSWLCNNFAQLCSAINTGGLYSTCNSVEQVSYAMSQYYSVNAASQGANACSFSGLGVLASVSTTTTPATTPSATNSTCQSMFSQLKCRTASEDPSQVDSSSVSSTRNWLCNGYPQFCSAINNGGAYSTCNSVEQVSYAMSQYYAQYGASQGSGACFFSGLGRLI